MFKNKLYNYFFLEFIKIFLITLFSLSVVVWIGQAARLLGLITDSGNSIDVYIYYTLLNMPRIINNVLILSFFVGIFFTIANFRQTKEIDIYFVSGISKINILSCILKITFLIFLFYYLLSIFFGPMSSLKARKILGNATFSIINTLVKEKNFNSPFEKLTIYIDKNDGKGKLEKVFIYDRENVTIARSGLVISNNNNFYIELFNGITFDEKNKKIKFFKSTIDISKYKLSNIDHPKFSERSIFWLFGEMHKKKLENLRDLRAEINKRMILPFFLFVISLLPLFLLNENSNNKKYKNQFILFLLGIFLIILNQILLNVSSKSFLFSIMYGSIILSIFILTLSALKRSFKK